MLTTMKVTTSAKHRLEIKFDEGQERRVHSRRGVGATDEPREWVIDTARIATSVPLNAPSTSEFGPYWSGHLHGRPVLKSGALGKEVWLEQYEMERDAKDFLLELIEEHKSEIPVAFTAAIVFPDGSSEAVSS